MSGLAQFQDTFAAALVDDVAAGASDRAAIDALVAQPGFAVYRNTVASALIDALQANYPTVSRLVGDEWFRAAASIYARSNPPRQPALVGYGEGFAQFLSRFEPAAGMPYLAGVASLDRLWTLAHVAADAAPLDPARVPVLVGESGGATRLAVHPAAGWAAFDAMPAATIWRRHRETQPDDRVDLDGIEWRGDAMLVTRPRDTVVWTPIDAGVAAFLDACADGNPLETAAAHATDAQPGTDLAALMALVLDAGALAEPRDGANDSNRH